MESLIERRPASNTSASSTDYVKRTRRRHVQDREKTSKCFNQLQVYTSSSLPMQAEALQERLRHPDEQRSSSEQVRWSPRRARMCACSCSAQFTQRPKHLESAVVNLIYCDNEQAASDSSSTKKKKRMLRTRMSSESSLLLSRLPFLHLCRNWSLAIVLVCALLGSSSLGYQLTNNLIANNLPPKFITSPSGAGAHQASNSEIVVRVKEGPASIGRLIYTLKGEDPDDDPLTFSVMGSTASDLLRIENVPGNQANVFLRKELDRETTESYTVVITLTDGKLGRGNWITKSMLIIVEDVNDNYPVFGPHRTAISIREDSKVPLVVETIEASDQDEGRFGQVIYRLAGDSPDESRGASSSVSSMFSVETIDGKGVISLISPLDYEQKALYQLRIVAIDRAIENERLSASTSILISVIDCQDQPPMFTFVPSITRIPENLPVGSPVVRVTAIDGDRGVNNAIQYKLSSVNGQESGSERNLFTIDSETGLVSVKHKLDRESIDSSWLAPGPAASSAGARAASQPGSYVLQILASELGSSQPASDSSVSTELTVILTDVNDEFPVFNQPSYEGEIFENSPADTLVNFISTNQESAELGAKVVDRDQGTNGTFTLHLEGEHSDLFDVWPHEATNEANLMIKVKSSPSSKWQLDYEKSKLFQLTIVAKEKNPSRAGSEFGAHVSSARMSVHLRDANDNYPQFESELYKVEIPENAIRGMHICAVKATDADSNAFGTQGIRYTEIRGEKANKFKLDPLTGVITLKTNEHGFDRETIAQHHLIVEARDGNGLGNRNTTQLLIVLTDINDQRPKFLLDQYEAFIYENEPDFQSPLQVQAIDNDAQNTANSKVTYSILSGDGHQNFTIDPQSGRIRVKSPLILPTAAELEASGHEQPKGELIASPSDSPSTLAPRHQVGLDFEMISQKRDDTRQFNLTIKATDSGLPEPLSSTTQVIVYVYDKNDHAPTFTRPLYSKTIREDAKEDSQVLQVFAQDGDHSPSHSKISYRISSGAGDKFVIDSDTGLISVAKGANLDIDRAVGGQKRNNYQLSVIAFDGSFGSNQQSTSTLVNITILDVNNKPPEFLTFGQTRLLANDQALPTTVAPIIPAQHPQLMIVHVNEDAPYGLIVTRVLAIDPDSTADLRYSINYARSEARNEDMTLVDPALIRDVFSIDSTEGTIKVAKPLDRELFDQVKLRLQVEDIAAQTPDQIAHTYLLVKITDINDNRPTFKRPVYKAVVNENSVSGTLIIALTAEDRDLNKTLRYSLDGAPEMVRLVRINPRSGEVMVNDKIDRELYSTINVTVKAEDTGPPHPLIGTAQLLITVRDENDNNPIFLNSTSPQSAGSNHIIEVDESGLYSHMMNQSSIYRHRSLGPSVSPDPEPNPDPNQAHSMLPPAIQLTLLGPSSSVKIGEDAQIGHQFAYVRAEDADLGNNGRVTYLLEASSSAGKFRIDRDSGVLSVAGALDRETTRQYSLIIEACDNYDLGYSTGESRRAFMQVNIQITDVNDNVPIVRTNIQHSSSAQSAIMNAPSQSDTALNFQSWSSASGGIHASYDDIMNSPGPYELPLSECVFINEFQPINEPILNVVATDADDPATGNGRIELSIVNNLPQNELFGLAAQTEQNSPMTTQPSTQPPSTTTTSAAIDLSGFGELTVGEGEASESLENRALRPKRSVAPRDLALLEPVGVGNFYAPASARTASFSILNSAQSTINQLRQRRPTITTTTTSPPAIITEEPTVGTSQGSETLSRAEETFGRTQAQIVVTQSLKERVGNYSILVRATDRGQPALSSLKLINICVLDINNHAPVFTRPPLNHTIRVMENATVGTFVTQVEATDSDHGANGELYYTLKPTNIQNTNSDWQAFKIDRASGIISTAKQFNRQLKKYYTLRVQAQDFGRPTSLSSDIDINIMIVNSGQYQPEFENQLQSLQFTENVAPGVEWFTLVQTNNLDDDPALIGLQHQAELTDRSRQPHQAASQNQPTAQWIASPCYFVVDSDDQEQVFHLDRYTHRLTNQKMIDRERKPNYTLLIQATNNCNKQPTPPIYGRLNSAISATYDTGAVNDQAGSAPATTILPTSTLEYRSASGSRRARRSLSSKSINETDVADSGGQSSFSPSSVDALLATDKSLLKVLIKIKDLNDNAPRFTQRIYTGGITTEADFGTVFMIAQAIDADADINAQVVYSIVKPIRRYLFGERVVDQTAAMGTTTTVTSSATNSNKRHRRAASTGGQTSLMASGRSMPSSGSDSINDSSSASGLTNNDISTGVEGDDLFLINSQTGEISLNFDPQKHMKGYFEFEIVANDTDGLFDSAKVFIYLLRQDQRVKFVLRLTPQELRQRLDKFRSVFGNITGAIVNIDSYKYFENHDGTVDKKKTSLYLHFVNPENNTIIDVDKVLTLIDNNIEYLDELYKEFHVLSSEAAHLPLSSSALIDPMVDQIRTGLMGVASFLALILVLVIALCLNQRTRYERQLKAATVSAFGSSPLHLDPDFHSQTNLPNTNLHSQDPNPIWMNGYADQDWLGNGGGGGGGGGAVINGPGGGQLGSSNKGERRAKSSQRAKHIDLDNDYLSSENSSDLNSLNGLSQHQQQLYNGATTATPRDSLNSSNGRVSGSGSGSSSTTNDQQALCRGNRGPQQQAGHEQQVEVHQSLGKQARSGKHVGEPIRADNGGQLAAAVNKRQRVLNEPANVSHSTFGAFKEVTIYTSADQHRGQYGASNLVQAVGSKPALTIDHKATEQQTSHVNKIASEINSKQPARGPHNQALFMAGQPSKNLQRIVVHANGVDVNQGIIRVQQGAAGRAKQPQLVSTGARQQQLAPDSSCPADNFESNLSKLSILNLETTEL